MEYEKNNIKLIRDQKRFKDFKELATAFQKQDTGRVSNFISQLEEKINSIPFETLNKFESV